MARDIAFLGKQNIECRMSIRVPVHRPVSLKERPSIGHLSHGYVSMRAETHDLSFDGTLIEASNPNLQKGAHVRLMLEVLPKHPLAIDALVVRSNAHGIALMFTEYNNEVLESMSAILAAEFNKYLDGRSRTDPVLNAKPFAESVNLHG